MKKDIAWLKKEIGTEMIELEPNRKERWSDVKYQTLRSVGQKIYQLDEPEVLSQEWIDKNVVHVRGLGDIIESETVENLIVPKQESEVLSQEESINIVLDDLKEYIKEQQSLSQNVGLAHTSAGNDTHYRQYDYVLECVNEYEPSDDLQNLLVPKQELPVIPKYVADWIKEEQGTMSNWKLPSGFISDSKYKKDQRRYKWSQVEGNMDKFMSALINSYEVEEEPLYYAMVKGHELLDDSSKYWSHNKYDSEDFFISYNQRDDSPIIVKNTKSRWLELGINDSNADFVKVEENE